MRVLASSGHQTVWGDFVGYRPGGEPLCFVAFDSSHWFVWAPAEALDGVRAAFMGVEPQTGPPSAQSFNP